MSSAKLCLMTAYMMTARFKEGEEAGFEAYRLLPPAASLESRKSVLQEIALSCSATRNKNFLKYLQEYKKVLDTLSEAKQTPKAYSYLLLESLYADYYLNEGTLDEARPHLKKMDEYFSPTTYIPCRGLYYNVYSHYYRITKEYEKALSYSQNAIELLSEVSDNEGLNYKIEHASILTEAGQADEAIPLFQSLLAKKTHSIGHYPSRRRMKSIRCATWTTCFLKRTVQSNGSLCRTDSDSHRTAYPDSVYHTYLLCTQEIEERRRGNPQDEPDCGRSERSKKPLPC